MAKSKIFYGWWVLASLFIFMFVAIGFAVNSFGFFAKPVTSDLNFSVGGFSLIGSISSLVAMFGALLVGNIINKVNIKLLMTVSAIIFASGIILFSTASSLVQFYIYGAIVGIGYAGIGGVGVSQIVTNWFKEKKGLAMAIAMTGSGLGGMFFPPVIVALNGVFGWRTSFIIIGLFVAAITLPFTILVIALKPADKSLMPYGVTPKNIDSLEVKEDLLGLTLGQAAKNWTFWGLCIVNLIGGMIAVGVQSQVPYALEFIGYSAAFVSIITVISNGVLILSKPLFGIINDKFGANGGILYVFIGYMAVFLMLCFIKGDVFAIIFGVIWGLAGPLGTVGLPLWAVATVGNKNYAIIFAIMSMFMIVGAAVGSPLAGFIFDANKSYNPAWLIFTIVTAVGMVIALISVSRGKKNLAKRITVEKVTV